MYVTVNIINNAANPPRMCEAELIVDGGAQLELLLLPKKVEQLQLQKVDEGSVRSLRGPCSIKTTISGYVFAISGTDCMRWWNAFMGS